MANNPWFRLYSEAVDDEKLRLLAFEDRWHFIALLCCKNNGILDTEPALMRRKVAVKLGLDLRELGEVGRRLSEVGLIDEETLQPIKWNDRQFKSDSSTKRVQEYRNKMKRSVSKDETNAKQRCNVSETAQEEDTDTDTDTEQKQNKPKSKELTKKSGQFVLPDWIRNESWDGFVAMRKSIKKPLTPHAMELMIGSLAKMRADGEDVNAVLEQSIMNSWQGVFPLKTTQRTSFADRKAKEKADNEAALDAWARGESVDSNSMYIEGEFGHA